MGDEPLNAHAPTCAIRSWSGISSDWSPEDHQVAHVQPLLRRTERRRPDAASLPVPRRLDVLDRRGEHLD
jgi:hypothetical protein